MLEISPDQESEILDAARNNVPLSQIAKWCRTKNYQPNEAEVDAWLKSRGYCRECNG